jgi:hypothetical protein
MIEPFGNCCSSSRCCSCSKVEKLYSADEFKAGDIVLYENNKRIEIIDSLYYVGNEGKRRSNLCMKFAHSSSHNIQGWRVIGNMHNVVPINSCELISTIKKYEGFIKSVHPQADLQSIQNNFKEV